MDNKKVNNIPVQGAEVVTETQMENEKMITTILQQPKEKKKQAVSISYTLKSQAENIRKLEEAGVLNPADANVMKEIHIRATKEYIKKEYGI